MSQPQGIFASQSDIEDQFGAVNVAIWSNLDNVATSGGAPTANAQRIQAALDWGDATINDTFLVLGNYTTPLSPEGTAAVLCRRWAAILAGSWLYLSRGLRDGDQQGNHLKTMQDQVMAAMKQHRSHEKLDAARRWPTATAPVGYEPRA